MAQSGFTPILTYASNTAAALPLAGNLTNSASGAELAVNTADKRLFTKDSGGSVVELGTNPSGLTLAALTASQAVFTNGSKALVSNAITGTGNVVMSASPTLTGTIGAAALTLSSDLTLSGGTANGVLYLNGSKVATSGSALTFDGTTLQSSLSSPALILNDTSSSNTALRLLSTGGLTYIQSGISAGAFAPIAFTANGGAAEQMRLTSTGLGIGTSSPGAKLGVGGNAIFSGGVGGSPFIAFSQDQAGGTPAYWQWSSSTGLCTFYTTDASSSNGSFKWMTGGSDKMFLDSPGNLGLGATPSAWSGQNAFQIGDTGSAPLAYIASDGASNTVTNIGHGAYWNGSNWLYTSTSVGATRYQMTGANAGSTHAWFVSAGGTAGNAISFTQAMTLDASGNLLVNQTSVSTYVNTAKFISAQGYTTDSNTTTLSTQRAGGFFRAEGGVSSNNQGSYCAIVAALDAGLAITPGAIFRGYGGNGGNNYNIQIAQDGNITNTNNSYGSLSDASIKENIVDATPKLNDLMAVQVRSYNLKGDEKKAKQLGVVAQELEAVFPSMVTTESDGLKSVKYSVFVPMLIKAIQEQQALIIDLRARVAALESN